MANKALKYVTATAPTNSANYVQPAYESKYGEQIESALGKVTNRQEFSYDPMKDVSFQALSKLYTKRGEKAAKSTMADAAALNGGLGTSYATSAAQQTRNDYNAELAALIPELEATAYQRYADKFNMDVSALGALQDAESSEYGKFRDTVGDAQWKYGQDYQKYRDAMSDYQWGQNYNLDLYSLKKANSGGGGGRRSSGGGGGSSATTTSSFVDTVKSGAKTTPKNRSVLLHQTGKGAQTSGGKKSTKAIKQTAKNLKKSGASKKQINKQLKKILK